MKIIIIGAGGHGRVVLDILRNNHHFELAGFLDSNPALHRNHIEELPILGDISIINNLADQGITAAIVAIGNNQIRQKYAKILENDGFQLINAIHPTAHIAQNASLGKNIVACAGVTVSPHVSIADSVICNTGSTIDYECEIHNAVHICPGVHLAGRVKVKSAAFIGIGSNIIQGLTIGESSIIGAGSVVLKNVPDYSTVVGVPAAVVKQSHLHTATGVPVGVSTADIEPARSFIARTKRIRPQCPPALVEASHS